LFVRIENKSAARGVAPSVSVGSLLAWNGLSAIDTCPDASLAPLPDLQALHLGHEATHTLQEPAFGCIEELFSDQNEACPEVFPFAQQEAKMRLASTYAVQCVRQHHSALLGANQITKSSELRAFE
jgi:hypothetical protein